MFLAIHPQAICTVYFFDSPYFDDSEEAAESVRELRAREAILKHQAWAAVDVMEWLGKGDAKQEAYRLIGPLLAELADDNVLAVVDPAEGQIFCYDPETEQKLRSDDPLSALSEMYYSPVIRIKDDDPRMLAAVSEARARFGEFVAAFEKRDPEGKQPFSVKARFSDGENAEFMWVEVQGIENDVIYGLLANHPAILTHLHEKDRVAVPLADLNDWIFVANEEMVGAFTVKVIAEHARRPPEPDDKDEA
jgi:uncharacterized protein YegJ (DUF2314 family)